VIDVGEVFKGEHANVGLESINVSNQGRFYVSPKSPKLTGFAIWVNDTTVDSADVTVRRLDAAVAAMEGVKDAN
jgi:hypothetical protein